MSRESGGSISVTTVGAKTADLTEPLVVMELADYPGWEVVAFVETATGTLRAFSVQPAGTYRADIGLDGEVAEPRGGVTARMVRSLPLGEITRVATVRIRGEAKDAATQRSRLGPSAWPNLDDRLDEWQRTPSSRPGRRGRPDVEYAAIAARYVAMLGTGTEVKDLAKALGYETSSIRNMLYEARRRGLLTPSPPGRSGGDLTAKAQALLEGLTQEGK